MEKGLTILHLEDNAFDVEIIQATLQDAFDIAGFITVDTKDGFIDAIQNETIDIILADYLLPLYSGPDALKVVMSHCPVVPFIFVSGALGDELAVETLKAGATDFVLKDRLKRLVPAVERALKEKEKQYKLFQAQQALRESEQKYQDLYDNAPDIHLSINTSFQVVAINRFGANYLGYDPDELVGKSLLTLIHEDDVGQIKKQLNAAFNQQWNSLDIELQLMRKDGSAVWVDENISYTAGLKATPELRIVCRDITRRKKLESQLIRAQKLEAIGTLAGGIAHDFNNILSGILGHTELLRMNIPQIDQNDQSITRILEAVGRAKKLISRIMDIARQEEDFKRKIIRLSTVVSEVITLLQSTLPSNIIIKSDFSREKGFVEINATRMHQVIMNLCTNAGHAMRRTGGELAITVKTVRLNEDNPLTMELNKGFYVQLTVADTGHGMDKNTLERIFDPYFTTKPPEEGTGMGLAVVQSIVKSYNGAVSVKSSKNLGTVFEVYFPMSTEKHVSDVSPRTKTTYEKGSGSILIVDDESEITDVSKDVLEKYGYSVTVFNDPVKGLETFLNIPEQFDMVITDMTMPGLTGDVFATRVLAKRADIPVIICTGYSEILDQDKMLAAGVKHIMSKPFSIDDLLGVVKSFITTRKEPA